MLVGAPETGFFPPACLSVLHFTPLGGDWPLPFAPLLATLRPALPPVNTPSPFLRAHPRLPRDDVGVPAARLPEPRAVIEGLNATLNAHDVDAGRAFYEQGARLVTGSGRTVDLDGLCRMLTATLKAFPDLRMSVVRWVTEGDTIVTEEVMDATHDGDFAAIAPTHRRVRVPMVHVTRVRDGRIIERVAYHDTAAILRQIETA